jgi:hypothetical protein
VTTPAFSSLAGTAGTGAGAGTTFGARAMRFAVDFFAGAVAARRLGAGLAFGLGLAARADFLAGFRAGVFLVGLRAAVFFLAVRDAAFFVVRRLAATARTFLGFVAFLDFVAARFFEDADRAFLIG